MFSTLQVQCWAHTKLSSPCEVIKALAGSKVLARSCEKSYSRERKRCRTFALKVICLCETDTGESGPETCSVKGLSSRACISTSIRPCSSRGHVLSFLWYTFSPPDSFEMPTSHFLPSSCTVLEMPQLPAGYTRRKMSLKT